MDLWLLPTRARIDAGLPELGRCLRRAEALPPIARGLDAALHAHGVTAPIPWAALLREAALGDAGDHAWAIADLVCVQAEPTTARIVALASQHLSADASAALFESLRPWFEDEAFALDALENGRCLLRCPPGTPDLETAALDTALGADLREITPSVRDWQRRGNEMQILLTQQTLNRSRVDQGLPAFNSLWFWGFGRLRQAPAVPFAAIASNDPLLLALARRGRLPVIGVAEKTSGAVLRDLRDPQSLAQAWKDGLRPVSAALRLHDGSGWRVRPWDRLRFWL
jgi:hypothetical protein